MMGWFKHIVAFNILKFIKYIVELENIICMMYFKLLVFVEMGDDI